LAENFAASPDTQSPASPAVGFDPGQLLGTLTANPYPLYQMLRSSQPVFRAPIPNDEGAGLWILTRYKDVQLVLRDSRFSVEREKADLVKQYRDVIPMQLIGESGVLRSMLLMDPPHHTRVRGLVSKAFTPRRVAELEPRIQAIIDELLEDPGDGMDVIADFAVPLPAVVIAELLGVPPEDHPRFKAWSTELIALFGAEGGPEQSIARAQVAIDALFEYLGEIVAQRRREPADDLISAMLLAQQERDALTDAELLATSNLLLIAGHETTTNLIGNGLLALLRNPEQLERLRADPALMPAAVEELLRYDSPVQATVRVATENVEMGDHVISKGAVVVCGIGAANRDPAAFDQPDRLDLGRVDNHHLSLGFGVHFCLGAPLARLEGQLALTALIQRFPQIQLGEENVEFRRHPILRGLTALPVRL
jgi:pimeloyl-[acyl-carrier protein] synthase